MKYQWLWNRFYGGLSQDRVLWPEWSFSDWVGIDVLSEVRYAKAAYGVNNFASSILPTFFHNLETWPYVVMGAGNTVYYAFPGSTSETTLGNLSTSADTSKSVQGICSGVEWGQEYVYIFSGSRIHRSPTPLSTGITVDHKTFTPWYEVWYPTNPINLNNIIYFNTSNSICLFNLSASSVTTGITFNNKNERIVWFSVYNDLFRIYTKTSNGSFLYIWNGISTQPSYTVAIPDIQIRWMVNMWSTDYIYSLWSLYAVSGTQYKKVFAPVDTSIFSPNLSNGVNSKGVCFIPTSDGTALYGSYMAGFPEAMTVPFQWDIIKLHVSDTSLGRFLYQYTASWSGKFSVINLEWGSFQGRDNQVISPWSTFTNVPFITSNFYTWDDTWAGLSVRKSITEINIWYTNATNTSLNLYMRQSTNDSWSLVKNISDTNGTMRIYPDELPFRDFVSLQYKVELVTSFVSWAGRTPYLSEIKTIYEPIYQ